MKFEVKDLKLKLADFVNKNKLELILLTIILIIGAFLRLYKISSYMTFLGDEGRDALIVRRFLVEGHPPLIGPGTSVGNMYLGPLYYYFMAPGLLLANFSPVGPAIEVAILGILTIAFVWWVFREWFPPLQGEPLQGVYSINFIALAIAFLYAISPTVIVYSRSSWNPNIMPFFSLLSLYSVWEIWKEHRFNWLIILGVSYAFVLQSHYLGLLLAPTIFLFLFLTFKDLISRSSKPEIKNFQKKFILGFLIFVGLMSPLFIFDIRHNWMNLRSIYKFFSERQTTVSIKPWNAIPAIPSIFKEMNTSLVGAKNYLTGTAISILMFLTSLILIGVHIFKKKNLNYPYLLLFSWIGFGLIGLGLYKQQIYDHYFGFLFPAVFIFLGACFQFLLSYKKAVLIIVTAFAVLVGINLYSNPLRYQPNYQLKRAEDVAKKIEQEAGGREFNIAVIAERNYPDGYKYFLIKNRDKVVDIDAQIPSTITNQLFVVCEKEFAKCNPTNAPQAEVANFGWSKIIDTWSIDGVTVFKLVHTK